MKKQLLSLALCAFIPPLVHANAVQSCVDKIVPNDPDYHYEVGRCYNDAGLLNTALANFERGAGLGESKSLHALAIHLKPSDPERSFKYLKRCADNGDQTCLSELATYYREGTGTPKSYENSARILEQLALKDPYYYIHLYTDALLEGRFDEAFEYVKQGAERKVPFCLMTLADNYENGYDVKQDFNEAIRYYDEACSLGSDDGCKKAEQLRGEHHPAP